MGGWAPDRPVPSREALGELLQPVELGQTSGAMQSSRASFLVALVYVLRKLSPRARRASLDDSSLRVSLKCTIIANKECLKMFLNKKNR